MIQFWSIAIHFSRRRTIPSYSKDEKRITRKKDVIHSSLCKAQSKNCVSYHSWVGPFSHHPPTFERRTTAGSRLHRLRGSKSGPFGTRCQRFSGGGSCRGEKHRKQLNSWMGKPASELGSGGGRCWISINCNRKRRGREGEGRRQRLEHGTSKIEPGEV